MRSKNLFIIFLVSVLGLSLSLTLSAQQGRGKGRLRGQVLDEVGNPIEGAKIVAQHLRYKTTFTSESDEKGSWAVMGLGTGYFRITASKEGYGTVYNEMKVSQFSKKNSPFIFTLRKIKMAEMNMPAIQDEGSVVLFEEGNELFDQKKYAEAAAKFEEFIRQNPSVYQVYINIGNCYKEMGEYDKAIEIYTKILENVKEEKESIEGDESAARALAGMGEAYFKQGNLEKASEYFRQAIDNFPEDETLAFNVGEIFFKQGKIDKAIEYFLLSVKINESWAPPHRQLGYAYLNKGKYRLAVDSLKEFVELAPDDPQAENIKNLIPKLEELIKDN
jgi:tetratricopeptide (TPR) repeat protein